MSNDVLDGFQEALRLEFGTRIDCLETPNGDEVILTLNIYDVNDTHIGTCKVRVVDPQRYFVFDALDPLRYTIKQFLCDKALGRV